MEASPLRAFLAESLQGGRWKATAVLGAGTLTGYCLCWITEGLAGSVLQAISGYLLWAVPLVLATALAVFGNLLHVYDLIRDAYLRLRHESLDEQALSSASSAIRHSIVTILGDAFAALLVVLFYYVVKALSSVPQARVAYPHLLVSMHPDWISVSIMFGLSWLMLALLASQFSAIPDYIQLYQFIALDVYRPDPKGEGPNHRLTGSGEVGSGPDVGPGS